MKKTAALLLATASLLSACTSPQHAGTVPTPTSSNASTAPQAGISGTEAPQSTAIIITIGDAIFTAQLTDTEAASALAALLPLELDMSELNGNEKFAYLPEALPTASEAVGAIEAGDLMLYGDSCLVLFYESFPTSYNYTRLGTVESPAALSEAIGSGDLRVTLSAEA